MEARSEQDFVRSHLRGRDVPCPGPGCGYNLRDSAGAACPECGRRIRLAEIRSVTPAAARRAAKQATVRILALAGLTALLWILVITAMGVSRSGDGQAAFVIFGPCAATPIGLGLVIAELSRIGTRRAAREEPSDLAIGSCIWLAVLVIACAYTLWTIATGEGLS